MLEQVTKYDFSFFKKRMVIYFLDVIAAEEIGLAETETEEENVDEKGMNILSAAWAQHDDLIALYLANTYIVYSPNVRTINGIIVMIYTLVYH